MNNVSADNLKRIFERITKRLETEPAADVIALPADNEMQTLLLLIDGAELPVQYANEDWVAKMLRVISLTIILPN